MVKTYLYRESSQLTDELDAALAKAQGEFTPVLRNQEGQYGMFANLASMESATRPALAKYGLCVRQYFVCHEDKSMTLVTELSKGGQFCVSAIPIPAFANPQATHSYCTYMARLGYSRILCLAVEDNDGEGLDQNRNASEVLLIQKAVADATTRDRLTELWRSVQEMELSPPLLSQLEEVFASRAKVIDANAKTKKAKVANADA